MIDGFKVIAPDMKLTSDQYNDMCRISAEGLGEKFRKALSKDRAKISQVVRAIFDANLMPLGERFALVDKNEKLVCLVLLNKTVGKPKYFQFIKELVKIAGLFKMIRIISGFLVMDSANRLRKGDIAEIYWVCTDPQYRGRGLASSLLKEIVLMYIKKKCLCIDKNQCSCKVTLSVSVKNTKAIRVYEKIGFVKAREYIVEILRNLMGEEFCVGCLMEMNVRDI